MSGFTKHLSINKTTSKDNKSNDIIFKFFLSTDIKDQSLKKILFKENSLKRKMVFEDSKSDRIRVFLLVGPEGGFTSEEKRLASIKGFIPVKVSSSILRTETAAILGVGLAIYEFENTKY